MKDIKPVDLDLSLDNLGMTLPEELAHLEQYAKYAKWLKEDLVGFKIPQFKEDGSPNPDWYSFRKNQIGSSEIATILGYDEYGDKVKLWYSKLGDTFPHFSTRFTMLGLHLEDKIADLAEYYDGTEQGWVDNKFYGKKIRTKVDMPFYAININYPHIAVSLDFCLPGGQKSPFTGEIIEFDAPLEIKNMSQMAHDKYEIGVPERYMIQLQIQMMALGVTYSEIAFLVAGNDFKMMPAELNVQICQKIITDSYEFWETVKEARKIYEPYGPWDLLSPEQQQEVTGLIQHLEPDPSGTDAFKEFYKEKYKNPKEEIERVGTEEEWELAVEYDKCNKLISDLTLKKEKIAQTLKMATRFEPVITFGDRGRVTNRLNANGRNYFKVNVKNYE